MPIQLAKTIPHIFLLQYLSYNSTKQTKIKKKQLKHELHEDLSIDKRCTKNSSNTEKGKVKYSITDSIKKLNLTTKL